MYIGTIVQKEILVNGEERILCGYDADGHCVLQQHIAAEEAEVYKAAGVQERII